MHQSIEELISKQSTSFGPKTKQPREATYTNPSSTTRGAPLSLCHSAFVGLVALRIWQGIWHHHHCLLRLRWSFIFHLVQETAMVSICCFLDLQNLGIIDNVRLATGSIHHLAYYPCRLTVQFFNFLTKCLGLFFIGETN